MKGSVRFAAAALHRLAPARWSRWTEPTRRCSGTSISKRPSKGSRSTSRRDTNPAEDFSVGLRYEQPGLGPIVIAEDAGVAAYFQRRNNELKQTSFVDLDR